MGALISHLAAFFPSLFASYLRPFLYTSKSEPVEFFSRRRTQGGDIDKDARPMQMNMEKFVKSKCPSLLKPYAPTRFLPNGHFQTIWCVIADYTKVDTVEYERTILEVPDGGHIGLDFCPPPSKVPLDPKTPTIVVVHGLTGGSYESYIRCVLAKACAPKSEGGLGYRACVMNFRGCSGVKLKTFQMFCPGYTDDLRITLMYLSRLYPESPLIGIGFSIGASVVTRYLGEEGCRSRLVAGCSLACPWDMWKEDARLDKSWFLRNLYSKALAANVIAILKENLESIYEGPPIPDYYDIPYILNMKSPTFTDIQDLLVSRVGGPTPLFPFPTRAAFCNWGSAEPLLQDIRVPFLSINAEDDPIAQNNPFDVAERNGWIMMATTRHGGHLGWFEGASKLPNRWMRKPVLEWLRAVGEDLIDVRKGKPAGSEWRDGFVREIGKDEIGFRVIEERAEIKERAADLLAGL